MVAALRCLLCRELSTPSLAAFHIHCFLHCVPWRPSSVLLLDLVCLQEDLLGWPFRKSLNHKKGIQASSAAPRFSHMVGTLRWLPRRCCIWFGSGLVPLSLDLHALLCLSLGDLTCPFPYLYLFNLSSLARGMTLLVSAMVYGNYAGFIRIDNFAHVFTFAALWLGSDPSGLHFSGCRLLIRACCVACLLVSFACRFLFLFCAWCIDPSGMHLSFVVCHGVFIQCSFVAWMFLSRLVSSTQLCVSFMIACCFAVILACDVFARAFVW